MATWKRTIKVPPGGSRTVRNPGGGSTRVRNKPDRIEIDIKPPKR